MLGFRTGCYLQSVSLYLGDICEVADDCIKRTKNAKCTGMTCVCVHNYYELNKQCMPVSIPVALPMLVVYQKIQYANRMIAFVRNSTLLNQSTCVFKPFRMENLAIKIFSVLL